MKKHKKALSLLVLAGIVGGLITNIPLKEVSASTVKHQYELADLQNSNFIKNGNFQEENNYWNIVGQNSSVITDSDNNKYGKLGKTTDPHANGHIWQDVTLKPNTTYILKAKVKVLSDDENSYVTLDVKKGGSSEAKYFKDKKVTAINNEWQEVSLEFTTDTTTKYAVGIGRWEDNASASLKDSEAYIDDVSVEYKDSIDKEKYDFVWADDFNNENLNLSDWEYELGSIRGIEQQHYVNDPENVSIRKNGDNGELVLKATDRPKELQYNNPRNNDRKVIYNSGSVRTHGKQEFLYGRIEMKAKLPKGQAVFPAFWTLGSDFTLDGDVSSKQGYGWARCGEIDIMELIGSEENQPGNKTVYQTIHTSNKPDSNTDHKLLGTSYTIDEDFYDDYHIFGIDWSKGKLDFYVDDKIVSSVDYSNDEIARKCLDRPQYIQFNLAMGGAWPGEISEGLAGTEFAIDYVYYAQTPQQKADAEAYYKDAPRLSGYKDLTIYEGETDAILENVVAENGDVDFSITDQPQFNKKEQNATSDNPLTSVDLLCTGKNDLDSLAKLPAGEYTLYYTALPKNMQLESSNPEDPNSPMVPLASEEYKFDRKAVNLTIKERNSNEEIPLTPIEPADPIVPDNPNNNNNSNNNNVSGTETPDLPKTGDTSKTNLLFYILVASGGLAIFSFSKKAKKKIIE